MLQWSCVIDDFGFQPVSKKEIIMGCAVTLLGAMLIVGFGLPWWWWLLLILVVAMVDSRK